MNNFRNSLKNFTSKHLTTIYFICLAEFFTIFLIFPDQLVGNIYVIIGYLVTVLLAGALALFNKKSAF